MKAELKCMVCVVEAEAAKEAGKAEPKVANAFIIYQGSSMCKRHMFVMMEAQVRQAQAQIAVPNISKVTL